jgi:hypothetical protein
VVEKAALGLRAAYDEYMQQAALGEVMHNDDIAMRILRLAREPADPRTGIFTSGSSHWIRAGKSPSTSAAPNMRERIWQRY